VPTANPHTQGAFVPIETNLSVSNVFKISGPQLAHREQTCDVWSLQSEALKLVNP